MFYIKKATMNDMAELSCLAYEVLPETYKDILGAEQMSYLLGYVYSPANLLKQMEEKGYVYLIAYVGKVPAGFVTIEPGGNDLFHLQKIHVKECFQNRTVGRSLFDKAIEVIREIHPEPCTVEMNANRSNSSLSLQEHLAMKTPYNGDSHIMGGYYMNDYIMSINS